MAFLLEKPKWISAMWSSWSTPSKLHPWRCFWNMPANISLTENVLCRRSSLIWILSWKGRDCPSSRKALIFHAVMPCPGSRKYIPALTAIAGRSCAWSCISNKSQTTKKRCRYTLEIFISSVIRQFFSAMQNHRPVGSVLPMERWFIFIHILGKGKSFS